MMRSPVLAAETGISMIDFPGRMAGVLFFPGCNLRCGFCHNASLLADVPREACLSWTDLGRRLDRFRDEWASGIVLTGGEPTLSSAVGAVLDCCRARGFVVKLDTNGTRPRILRDLLPRLDYVALDIKASPEGYPKLTGLPDARPVERSLTVLRECATDYELRTTVIEPFHTDEEMDRIAGWISGARRWVLQPFVPRFDLPKPAYQTLPRTCPQRMAECRRRWSWAADDVTVRSGLAP